MISILDCTLRDGGYINDWNFKDKQIQTILKALKNSRVDCIEVGYLDACGRIEDSTKFLNLATIDAHLSNLSADEINDFSKNTESQNNVIPNFLAMINLGDFDIAKLPPKHTTLLNGIRLSFHKERFLEALEAGRRILDLGYQLYFQPMITKRYSDLELLNLIEQVNVLRPNAFYIVDSFGSMGLEEFDIFLAIIHHNLARDIKLGFHSHNNMQLAFANAIKMCSANLKREIVLDCSIYGMGRGAGNLNTELIMDYLNSTFDASYQSFFLLEVIDTLLGFLFLKHSWGFSPAQYLSASLDCHPNYATYLITKNSIPLLTIWNILHQIPKEKRLSFDEKLIEKLLLEYLCKAHSEPKGEIGLHRDSKVLLIASGKSVVEHQAS